MKKRNVFQRISDTLTVWSVVSKIKKECKGAPPIFIVKTIIKYAPELPESMRGNDIFPAVMDIAKKVVDMPYDELEVLVKRCLK